MQILGAIGHVILVSKPKNEMPILGLNSSSSKTNGTNGIKLSNLDASGHALSALKHKPFFIYLFIYYANHMVVTATRKPPKLES